LSSAPKGRGSWHWGELCGYLDTYLVRLIEDIEENPDDPAFRTSSHTGAPSGAQPSFKTNCDVFWSYSTRDKDEARDIDEALRKSGKSCFLAEKTLKPGDKFKEEIRSAIAASKEVWILVSPNSIQSTWVQREVSAAWALQKRIVPVLLRCGPSNLPDILADMHAIDYHNVSGHIAAGR
jgi:hypothetical protein